MILSIIGGKTYTDLRPVLAPGNSPGSVGPSSFPSFEQAGDGLQPYRYLNI